MSEWEKRSLQLRPDHLWRAKKGYKIFVADRGAVRLDFPADWIVTPTEDGTIKFHDKQPPDDNCCLQLTVLHLRPDVDWSGLPPLTEILEQILDRKDREEGTRGPVQGFKRSGFELAWSELHFIDEKEQRPARSRTCLARKDTVQIILTLDFWESDAAGLAPVWDDILRSLRLAAYIGDPTLGDRGRG